MLEGCWERSQACRLAASTHFRRKFPEHCLATLCTFGAFVAGIYITFGFLDTDVFVATLVMAIPVGCTVLYNLFGPLCSYTPIKNAWKYVYEGGLCESG